ncbi:replication protein [Sporosarcina sp. FSL K6-2383]|uniref:replication protein n=1 Tax=Sporosarcina sp. FSL K6-2383 TaxID=2921556 RepID=UPI00315AE7ED
MASPQKENGFTGIANEILEAVQKYKFSLNEMKIIMCVWRFTYGFNRKSHAMSLSFLENHTGLSRSRINASLKKLIEDNVLKKVEYGDAKRTNSYKFNKHYNTWGIEKYASFTSVQDVTVTSVQIDTSNGVQNETTTSVQDVTVTSVQIDTQERKVKEILNKDIKTEEKKDAVEDDSSENYLRKLLNRFVELRAFGFDFKPADLNAAKEIQAAGVPLLEAISSLEESFRNYNPRHARDRIHSLSYCVGFILDRHFPAQNKSRKSTREEITPEWFGKEERAVPVARVSDIDIERERQQLLQELRGEKTV